MNHPTTSRVERLTAQLTATAARHPNVAGAMDVAATALIEAVLVDSHLSEAERLAEIGDVIRALRLAEQRGTS